MLHVDSLVFQLQDSNETFSGKDFDWDANKGFFKNLADKVYIAPTKEQIGLVEQWNAAQSKAGFSQEEFLATFDDKDPLKTYFTTLNGGIATQKGMTGALNKTTLASKAATLGMKALSMAGNMVISFGIGIAIDLLIKGITALVQAQEKTIEKANEVSASLKEQKDSLDSNKTIIDELSTEYEKLAQGVDRFGKNISLTSTEYARYNEISAKLSEMFPNLITKHEDIAGVVNNEKISVQELTQAYKDQQQAYYDSVMLGSKDVWDGFEATTNGGFLKTDSLNGELEKTAQILNEIATQNFDETLLRYANLSRKGIKDPNIDKIFKDTGLNKPNILETNDEYFKYITDNKEIIESFERDLITRANAQVSQLKPIINGALFGNQDYQSLSTEARQTIDKIVSSLDYDFFANSGFKSETDIFAWLENSLITPLKDSKVAEDVSKAYSDLLTLDKDTSISVKDAKQISQEYINQIVEGLSLSTEQKNKIFNNFSNDFADITEKIQTIDEDMSKISFNMLETLSEEDLNIALQIKNKGDMTFGELIDAIEEYKRASNNIPDTPSLNLTPLSDTLKNLNSEMSILSTAWNEMDENQNLNIQTVQALIEADTAWISLLEVEGGQIKLNKDLMVAAGKAKIQAKIDETKAIIENTKLEIQAFAASNTAYMAVLEGRAGLGVKMDVDKMGIDDTKFKEDQKNLTAATDSVKVLESLLESMSAKDPFASFGSGNKSSGSKEIDTWKEEFEKFYKELQYQRDKYIIDEGEYYVKLTGLNEKYFKNRKEYLDDYRNYELEAENGLLKLWEDKMKSQGDAYIERADKEIKKLNEQKKIEEEFYDKKIEAVQKQKEALQEQYTEEDKLLTIEEKRQALLKAQTQLTNLVFKDGKFDYMADQDAVDNAQKDFDDATKDFERYQIEQELDNQIEKYQEAKKNATDSIDSQIEKWEVLKESVNEQLSLIGEDLALHQENVNLTAEIELMFTDGATAGYNNMATAVANYVDTYIAKMEEIKAYREMARSAVTSDTKSGAAISQYATGRTGVKANKAEPAIIDEYNKRELLARNLDGRYVSLEYGDQVFPANISKAVMDNFHMLSSINTDNFMKSFTPTVNLSAFKTQQSPTPINIGDIKIINPIGDADSLAKDIIANFGSKMKQRFHQY